MKKFLFAACVAGMALPAYGAHEDPVTPILLGLMVIFLGAKIGGYLALKIRQPAVLGELIAGIFLGNLGLVHFGGLEFIKAVETFDILASIGVVLLLFEVGLESSIGDLMKVGFSSTIVAVLGVLVPFGLGWAVSIYALPEASEYVHAFIGATLCATSVGITARVLKDMGQIKSKEAKIILGAAVIDDVLGLIILAVVSGIIVAANAAGGNGGGLISFTSIAWITFKAVGFLFAALIVGMRFGPMIFRWGAKIELEGMLMAVTLSTCFLFAYLANLAGLAPIVGAFAAGLIIDGTGFAKHYEHEAERSIEHLLIPVSRFFVPIFFVTMGMKVDLMTFVDPDVLMLAAGITAAAIIGKQVCAFGVIGSGVNRMAIGIGMIPRGEVGLIFAAIGAELTLNGEKIIGPTLFSAIVVMVAVTTMMTPPALTWSMRK